MGALLQKPGICRLNYHSFTGAKAKPRGRKTNGKEPRLKKGMALDKINRPVAAAF
jgi:hypothetical protein